MKQLIFLDTIQLSHYGEADVIISFHIDPNSGHVIAMHQALPVLTLSLYNAVYLGSYKKSKQAVAKIVVGNASVYFQSNDDRYPAFSLDRSEVRTRWFNTRIIDFFIIATTRIFSAPTAKEQLTKLLVASKT